MDPLSWRVCGAFFDIERGARVPHSCGFANADEAERLALADHLIPEGCDGRDSDFTFSILGRPQRDLGEGFVDLGDEGNSAKKGHDDAPEVTSREVEGEAGKDGDTEVEEVLYGVSVVARRFDSTVARGAVIRGLGLFCTSTMVDALRPLLVHFLQLYMKFPEQRVVDALYDVLRRQCTEPVLFNRERRHSLAPFYGLSDVSGASVHRISLPDLTEQPGAESESGHLFVQLPDVSWGGLGQPAIGALLRTLGVSEVLSIYHAVICGHKVLVTGSSAGSVSNVVMTLAALVAPAIPFARVQSRLFPYVSLFDITFLQVPGWIAGTTNPRLAEAFPSWDVHVVLAKGGVRYTKKKPAAQPAPPPKKPAPPARPAATGFGGFFEALSDPVGRKIQNMTSAVSNVASGAVEVMFGSGDEGSQLGRRLEAGLALDFPDQWLHEQFRVHTQRVVDATGK
jgi:Stabilization of polarity axis